MTTNDFAPIVYAYIDPGTGSAFIAIFIALISVVSYGIKGILIKITSGIHIKSRKQEKFIPLVIYTDSKRYWNTFKSICDEFERRKVEIKYLTQSKDDPVFDEKYEYVFPEFIGEGNKGITKMNYLNADIVLSTTPSLNVYQWKRSKKVKYYVHILHACNDLILYRMFGVDYYDSVLVNGQFQIDDIKRMEKLRNLPEKDCQIVGLTYFDQLKNRLKTASKIENKTPVVLVAPSWGPSSLLNKYGSKLIDELINTGYEIVIRPHPQSYISEKDIIDKLMNKYKTIVWNKDNDNFDILNKADILISDYSGTIFDFAIVFEKPIIYVKTDFDDSTYDSTWLEGKPWIFRALSEIGRELNENNFNNIKDLIYDSLKETKNKEKIEKIKQECWNNVDNSASSIVEYIIKKEKEIGN